MSVYSKNCEHCFFALLVFLAKNILKFGKKLKALQMAGKILWVRSREESTVLGGLTALFLLFSPTKSTTISDPLIETFYRLTLRISLDKDLISLSEHGLGKFLMNKLKYEKKCEEIEKITAVNSPATTNDVFCFLAGGAFDLSLFLVFVGF
uniref:Uncharacterized protein n=1 Tax=Romanomermis culicivorax TaxID=13658 RepID=A0A915L9H1_ROMCU